MISISDTVARIASYAEAMQCAAETSTLSDVITQLQTA